MSGYQIANNVPNFFIPNAQQELVLTQLDFLLNTYQKPAEHVFSAATGTVTLTAQQVLDGLVVLEAGIGGAVAVQLPTAAAIFNELQARVFGQQNITANEIPTAVRTNFFGLTRGFNFQTKIINLAGGAATIASVDANLTVTQVAAAATLPTDHAAGINFVVTAIPTTLLPTQKKVCAILLTGA
jgi:hypothetical protein